MDPDRVDLSAIDLRDDALRWERMVKDVLRAGGFAPRAARPPTPVHLLLRWTRPVLAAAAAMAALALPVITGGRPGAGPPPVHGGSPVAEALGMPAPVAHWVQADRTPETDRMVLATLGAGR